ncbi:MAG: T9SS type A sorting domain-containing protein [Flavobacteriales bacterium]|nr:T9SS type A sorting domain-containing protein [Flavobacteriales bacterium]
MRAFVTHTLLAVAQLTFAQFPGDTLNLNFDEDATLVLDSVYPAGCWQVGTPMKSVFTSALSLPHALVTDTLLPYPVNSTCYAQFTLIADEPSGYFGRWIEFDQQLDITLTTHAWIEAQDPWSGNWHRFGTTWEDGWLYSNALITTGMGMEFGSTPNGWDHVVIDSPCLGLMDGGNERWYDPIMRLRFVFTSLGNPQQRDGWMIDNVRATATICTSGIDQIVPDDLRMVPVPADRSVQLSLDRIHGDVNLTIRAADGRVVRNERAQSNDRMILDVSDLTDGIYVCSVVNDRTRLIGRLVVRH